VLAGPICRLSSLLPQFRRPISPNLQDISEGVTRILQGLFMKVLAEILGFGWDAGAGVQAGFDRSNATWGGLDVWFLAIGFGFQLFFDFAGYSHIAIGAARVIGFRLEENFDRPYLSPTPAAFWTRWHMSLSFWIRDYVFLQLARLNRKRWWAYSALMLSMVVVGLWHEATAPFMIWGAYHGCLLVSHRLGQQVKRSLPYRLPPKLGLALSWASTFCLVSVGWLFFRSATTTQAWQMSRAILAPRSYGDLSLPPGFYLMTSAIVIGWALFHSTAALLARWRAAYEENVRRRAELMTAADERVTLNDVAMELIAFGAARRWSWLAPLIIVVGLFAGLAISDLQPGPPRTPFMYTLF
jgi:alginate O-acetyltransferase complex protein AlgI